MLFGTLVVVLFNCVCVCTYVLPKAIAGAIVVITNLMSTHLLFVSLLLLMVSLRGFSVASKHNAHILGSLFHPAVTSEYRILEGSLLTHIQRGVHRAYCTVTYIERGVHVHTHSHAHMHAQVCSNHSLHMYMQSTSCVVH